MKQSAKEFDQYIRRELSNLPDEVPLGGGFDAERLWADLRPQLVERQGSRSKKPIGWWIAASIVFLTGPGWLVWTSTQREQVVATVRINPIKPVHSVEVRRVASSEIALPEKVVGKKGENMAYTKPVPVMVTSEAVHTAEVINETPPTVSASVKIAETEMPLPLEEATPILPQQPQIVVNKGKIVTAKRRFQVVHVSELNDYDQRQIVQPKLPTEALVQFRLPTVNDFVESSESNWSYLRRTKNNHSLTN